MFKFSKKVKTLFFALPMAFLFSTSVHAASYQVASGDTLYKLGQLFNTSTATIKQDNQLSSNMIYPGMTLYVAAGTYTVKSGDTLYIIASKYGVSINSIRMANHQWDNNLYPGQKLIIPTAAQSSSQPTTAYAAAQQVVANSSVVPYTQNDLDLLARLITAEAQEEPYTAQVGVGAVVLNRVKDSRFPNTISGVIYEKDSGYYQFTPVENGWINKPATDTAKQAAYDALHGYDPTHGAVYYFDDSTTNQWLWSKPIALRVDKMVFTY